MVVARTTLADKILKGEFSAAPSLLPADIPGNDPSAALGEDTAKAKDLLTQAGFKDGAGIPPLSLTYNSSSVTDKNVAEYLQNVWKENLGVSVDFNRWGHRPPRVARGPKEPALRHVSQHLGL